jgi:hypothetical protein
MRRSREPGTITQQGIGTQTTTGPEWNRVNVVDGSWAFTDQDDTAGDPNNASNTAGVNRVTVDTTTNAYVVDGCTFYKEVYNADGSSIEHSNGIVSFEGYIHLPNIYFEDTAGTYEGTGAAPAIDSANGFVAVAMGLMSDPELLPTAATPLLRPRDILGHGIGTISNGTRLKVITVRNRGTGGSYGSLQAISGWLDSIQPADVEDGHKQVNRLWYSFQIQQRGNEYVTGLNTSATPPKTSHALYMGRYDNGDSYTDYTNVYTGQVWGRTRTSRLHLWVAVSRWGWGASVSTPIDFDCYYRLHTTNNANNPSGTTGLVTA